MELTVVGGYTHLPALKGKESSTYERKKNKGSYVLFSYSRFISLNFLNSTDLVNMEIKCALPCSLWVFANTTREKCPSIQFTCGNISRMFEVAYPED